MRYERLVFLISVAVLVLNGLLSNWLDSDMNKAQQRLDAARVAPNATVGRLELGQYNRWMIQEASFGEWSVENTIGEFRHAEDLQVKDQAAYAAAYTKALVSARNLVDAKTVRRVTAWRLASIFLIPLIAGLLALFAGIAILGEWVRPPKREEPEIVVDCPHHDDDQDLADDLTFDEAAAEEALQREPIGAGT